MEPFGLFNFLKTLLSDAPTQDGAVPEQIPTATPAVEEKSSDVTAEFVLENETKTENAYVQFLQAHEARIKRLK